MNPADDPVVTDDARGIHSNAVGFVIMSRDARAQGRNAERLGVAEPARRQRVARGRDRACRSRSRRLTDFQMHHLAAGRFDPGGRRHDIHHHERRHLAARRRHDQAFGRFQHVRPL